MRPKGEAHESLAAFYLPPYLQKFRMEHPQMRVLLHPGICHDLRLGVKDGTYDFTFLLDQLQEHPDLIHVNLGEEELVVVAAPGHRLAQAERVEASDFSGENWIFTETGCSYRMMIESVLREAGAGVHSSLEFGSMEAIKQCVSYDLGIALVPKIAAAGEGKSGSLVILPFSHPEVRVYRQLVYHKKKWMPQALRYFLDLLAAGGLESPRQQNQAGTAAAVFGANRKNR